MSTYEKIVTLFDTAEHAQSAEINLQHAGFHDDEISIVSGKDLPKSDTALREPGLWHRLFGGDIEQHEATVYAKAVESGGVVLTLRAEKEDVPKAMAILNQHNLVDVKDRAVDTGVISKEFGHPLLLRLLLPSPLLLLCPRDPLPPISEKSRSFVLPKNISK
jgi:hypothetical protein